MIWLLLLLCWTANAADHDTFKNCSRIPFCAEMRNQEIEADSQFAAIVYNLQFGSDFLYMPLRNSKGDELRLEISIYEDLTARINITEKNNTRYQLKDVLDGEPKALMFQTIYLGEGTLTLAPYTDNGAFHQLIIYEGPPFYIEFYAHRDQVVPGVVLRGDQFTMKNGTEFSFSVEFPSATYLYGLHHHAVDLELPDTESMDPFRLRNSDNAGYEVGSPMALYGSVPVVLGHSKDKTSGIFLHNAAEQWVDISYKNNTPSAYFMVESGTLDLFVMLGNTTDKVVEQITKLTGKAHLPQLWTLGYHQCRWSYMTQDEVKEVVAQMDSHDFQMDAIWLDIDYTDGKRYFTWNPTNFSDPVELQKNISSTGRKLVTILDPHIKVDNDYSVYAGAKGKYFVKWDNGSDFEGECWPGISSYIDFLSPEARDYYAGWYSYDKFVGSTEVLAGVWNDMNEPSVFDNSLEKTFPFELVHYGNVTHRNIHNIYGFLQTKATHQGLMQRDNGTKRPFILTRSHFAGSQRYAAMWTGDNTADWPYLRVSYSECILSNLLGHVFCGADTGGFAGNPDTELLQRWYQAGIWLPFFRGHAAQGTDRREPYVFPEDVQNVIRSAIELRYKHIYYFYTLFYEHVRNGAPIVKPVFYDYPGWMKTDGYILVGSNILARPVMQQGATNIEITLPGEAGAPNWYRVDDNSWSVYAPNNTINIAVNISTSPLFYREGSIIPRKDNKKRSTEESKNDPYILYVNVDRDNNAVGRIYVDDYVSFDYLQNKFAYVQFDYNDSSTDIEMTIIDGNADDFNINIQDIVVHTQPSSEELQSKKIVYTHTLDQIPLIDLNLNEKLKSGKVSLKLSQKC